MRIGKLVTEDKRMTKAEKIYALMLIVAAIISLTLVIFWTVPLFLHSWRVVWEFWF